MMARSLGCSNEPRCLFFFKVDAGEDMSLFAYVASSRVAMIASI